MGKKYEVKEVKDVHEAIMRLYRNGSLKDRLLTQQKERSFDATVKQCVETVTKGEGITPETTIIKALREGKSSIGRPVIGKSLQLPVFSMAAPIRNAQGQPIAQLIRIVSAAGRRIAITGVVSPSFATAAVQVQEPKAAILAALGIS